MKKVVSICHKCDTCGSVVLAGVGTGISGLRKVLAGVRKLLACDREVLTGVRKLLTCVWKVLSIVRKVVTDVWKVSGNIGVEGISRNQKRFSRCQKLSACVRKV